jgi:hypothetical protein
VYALYIAKNVNRGMQLLILFTIYVVLTDYLLLLLLGLSLGTADNMDA